MIERKRQFRKKILAWMLMVCMGFGMLPMHEVLASQGLNGDIVNPPDPDIPTPPAPPVGYMVYFRYPSDFNDQLTSPPIKFVTSGECVEMPTENIENEHRKILGWTTEPYGTTPYDFSTPVTNGLTLYPICDKWRLTFSDVGEDGSESFYVDAGNIFEEPYFGDWIKGWRYYDEDEGDYINFDFSAPINRDYDLSPITGGWTTEWEVTFYYPSDFERYDGEGWCQYVKDGEPVSKPTGADADNGKRKIIGWTLDKEGKQEYDFSQPVTSDLTLYPVVDKHIVHFDYNSADAMQDLILYVNKGDKIKEPDEPVYVPDGYYFTGWEYHDGEDWHIFDFSAAIYKDYKLNPSYKSDYTCYVRIYTIADGAAQAAENKNVYIKNGTDKTDAVFEGYPVRRPGYVFTGWYYDKACTVECKAGEKFNPNYYGDYDRAADLYAGWKRSAADKNNIGYCYITVHRKTPMWWYGEGVLVEKGTLPSEAGLPGKWNAWWLDSRYHCYLDEAHTIPFDQNKPITEDIDVYVDQDPVNYLKLHNYNGNTNYIYNGNYPPASRPGYTFTGWYHDKDCQYRWDEWTPEWATAYNDRHLFAGWQQGGNGTVDYNKPNIGYYALNFSYNYDPYYEDSAWDRGGYWSTGQFKQYIIQRNNYNCNNIYIEKGKSASAYKNTIGDPSVYGHYFMGWYLDKEGTKPFDFDAVLTGDTVVYAKWGTNPDGSVVTPQNGNEVKPDNTPAAVTAITLSQSSVTVPKGKSAVLTAAVTPVNAVNAQVTWTSSDAKVAEVVDGRITGKKAGNAVITAQTQNGIKVECRVTVAEVKLNASLTVLKTGTSSNAVKIKEKFPKNDSVKSYQSSNPKLVKVDKKGKIKAGKKTGKATITVTMKSGATASYKVTVQKKAVKTKKLSLSKKSLTLKKGKKAILAVTRSPISAKEKITWKSSAPKVAAVNNKGVVSAKKKGKATITVRSANGKKATCKVTVK